jgi:anaerobic ribonucleoside-triphosphate reductase
MTELCYTCNEHIHKCDCGETEGFSEEGAVCPYCGWVDLASESEGYIYNKSNETNRCPRCTKEYEMWLNISYSWETHRTEDEGT